MGKIIDGKALSQKIFEDIKKEHDKIKEKVGRSAGLAVIIVGENAASQVYVRNKIRACEKVGFYSETIRLPEDITQEELLCKIRKLNEDKKIDGILVQLPLPKHIDELKVINEIASSKDVDGFHTENIGKMMIGDKTGFLPCTPYGIMQMFEEYGIELSGKDAVIVGRSNIVGKPLALLLIQSGATVQVCNSKTKNLSEKLQKADIVVAAVGVPKLIKGKDIKENAVVIDVGINRVDGKLCGDVDLENVKNAYMATPVPKGVGAVTTSVLAEHLVRAAIEKRMN